MKNKFIETISPGDIVFDLGAHVGYYSLMGSRVVGEKGVVYAFEPLPRNLNYLEQHLKLNKINNVVLYRGAVDNFEGVARFTDTSPVGAKISEKGNVEVKVYALEKLVASGELPVPNVIKMDIEGSELALLTDIRELLNDNPIRIFLSTHGREKHEKCIRLLKDTGYNFYPLDGHDIEHSTEVYCYK